MKILRETVRKIDWGLVGLIVAVAVLVFFSSRYGSVSRSQIQADDILRLEEKLDRLTAEQ